MDRVAETSAKSGAVSRVVWSILAAIVLLLNLALGLADADEPIPADLRLSFVLGQVLLFPLIIVCLFLVSKRYRNIKSCAKIFFFTSLFLLPSTLMSVIQKLNSKQDGSLYLAEVASEVNRTLPRMIDEETKLISVEGRDGVFTFNYTLVNHGIEDLDPEAFGMDLQAEMVERACSAPGIRNNLLAKGVTVRYRYTDRSDQLLGEIDVEGSQCVEETEPTRVDGGDTDLLGGEPSPPANG